MIDNGNLRSKNKSLEFLNEKHERELIMIKIEINRNNEVR